MATVEEVCADGKPPGAMAPAAAADLVQLQAERLPRAMNRAEEKLRNVTPSTAASRLLASAHAARNTRQRVVWLQRAASAWAEPLQAVAACRKGCSACCNIPVAMTEYEALLIAAASNRPPATPTISVRLSELGDDEASWRVAERTLQESATSGPCPFLRAGSCTVYSARPAACRTLLNLDDDALLCQRVDGSEANVPYADARQLKAHYLALQPAALLADIRSFFPQSAA